MVAAPKKKPEDLMIKQIIVHLRFTEKDYEKLKEICEERNMKINGFIRNLIKKAINKWRLLCNLCIFVLQSTSLD